jgi:glutathione synthase/RimK-type ligase-like ATP-grasp enzyme
MVRILQLIGLNDNCEITIAAIQKHMAYQVEKVSPLLDTLDAHRYGITKILIGGPHNERIEVPITDLIFNSVCDPDGYRQSLGIAEQITSQIDVPVINHPKSTYKTGKDTLWQLFGDRNDIQVPKTIRVAPRRLAEIGEIVQSGEMKYPFLFKEAGEMEVQSSFLVKSSVDIRELERFAFDGRDYYMTAFVDYRSRDGLYRKYRLFAVGGRVSPGYLIVANQWSILNDTQAKSTFRKLPAAIKSEEQTFLKTFRSKQLAVFKEMYKTLGLDYFGIDCGFDNLGRPILFSVSSCKHFLSRDKDINYYSAKQRSQLMRAVEWMITRKLNKQR